MDLVNVDSDDEQENAWEQSYSGRNGYIFLIDVRKPMFQSAEEAYFLESFKICLEAMLQIAREQRYDLVSFVLFGTSKSEGKFAPNNVVLLHPLQTPSVPYISKIREIIMGEFADIIEKNGQSSRFSLAKAINYCKSLLYHCRTRLYNKSIILFTTDDDPCKNDENLAHATRKRAEELHQHQVDLEVIGLGGDFDSSKFYKELVLTSKGELLKDWVGNDPVKKIEDVQKEIGCISRKFSRHFGTFYLGDEAKLKILFYKLYHEPQKLMWTSRDTILPSDGPANQEETMNHVGQPSSFNKECDTNQLNLSEVEASEITVGNKPNKYCLIGGRYIPITKTELKWYEAKVSKGLTLIGFRPISSIPAHLVGGEACFIVPDMRDKGSAELFSLLHESCLQKNIAALCWFAITKSACPTPVILFPVESSCYASGKNHPSGFHVIKMPFSDMISDCSEVDDLPEVIASDIQCEAADGIIKKTTINWSPDTFSDVEYKKRIAMIEAVAMEYSEVSTIDDETDVDLTDIAERLGELNEKFLDYSHLPPEALGKRLKKEKDEDRSAKEMKTFDPAFLISKIKEGKAEQLTVAQLKELLKGEGIKSLSAMTKPRLVAVANSRFK